MQILTNSDILALIDDLNQYVNGNLTIFGLSESLAELQNKLSKQTKYDLLQTYLSKCGNYEYTK